mmetsp:Transcript_19451/g.39998  ORF Transcript_19451/g.39998 Transcript_19451/m.39998 type:complete len:208 (-) Transcript_19451:564-1187(-)
MNLQNFQALRFIGFWNFNLAIKSPRTQERRIQNIGTIGRHNHFHLSSRLVESVHLVQQFEKRSLNLTIRTRTLRKSTSTDGIDFVHKDYAWFVILGKAKHFSNHTCRFSNILVHNGRRNNFQECRVDITCQCTCQQRFTCSRWSVKKNSLGCLNPNPRKQLGICQRQFNDFPEFSNLLVQSSNIRKGNASIFFRSLHVKDSRIDFSR